MLVLGLVVMEDEWMRDEREVIEIQKQSSPVGEQLTLIMTGEECTGESIPEKEMGKEGSGFSKLNSSLLESFQLLYSSQGSEKDRMITYIPPPEEVKVLQFEDSIRDGL